MLKTILICVMTLSPLTGICWVGTITWLGGMPGHSRKLQVSAESTNYPACCQHNYPAAVVN